MSREPLPTRRQSDIREVSFGPSTFTVCIGYYGDGRPGEVFVDGHKTGAGMGAILADACVLISLALQCGLTPEEVAKSLGSEPGFVLGKPMTVPSSPIGAILEVIRARPELAVLS